jgi:hypothetical protein
LYVYHFLWLASVEVKLRNSFVFLVVFNCRDIMVAGSWFIAEGFPINFAEGSQASQVSKLWLQRPVEPGGIESFADFGH